MVQVWRKGSSRDLGITVGEIPDEEGKKQVAARDGKPAEPQAANRLGLVLAVPTAEQKKALDIQHGLIVEDVKNGSTRSEVRAGDIILSAIVKGTQTDIKSLSQFNDMVQGPRKERDDDLAGQARRLADIRHHQGPVR